jgi:GntR family transcriptional regulator
MPPEPALPAWQRVQDHLAAQIAAAALRPGERIPAERLLAQALGVSRMTVRQGIEALVRRGLLVRNGTAGTLVAVPKLARLIDTRRSFSLTAVIERAGARPGSRLLQFHTVPADAGLAARLQLPPRSPLVVIQRLRSADGQDFCVETSHLPAHRLPGLAAADIAGDVSLYRLLATRYGIETRRRRGEIGAGPAGPVAGPLLGLEAGATALLYSSTVFDAQDRPVEHTVSVNHPDRVTFLTEQEAG